MKKVIIVIVISVTTIVLGGLGGLYFVGDKIVEEALIGDVDELLEEDISLEDSIENTESDSKGNKKDINSDEYGSENSNEENGDDPKSQEGDISKDGNNKENTGTKEKKDGVTVNKMKEVNDNISKKEKVEVAATVVRRLDIGEINDLKGMAKGGLTENEKTEVRDIIYGNFTEEEIQKLQEMYSR